MIPAMMQWGRAAILYGVVFSVVFGGIVSAYYTIAPMVETQFFPVTSKLEILDFYVKPRQPDNSIRAVGQQVSRVHFAAVPFLDTAEIRFVHRCPPSIWLTTTEAYP